MSLAKRVRDYRFAKGWGPDELANRASISRTALYQIESGKTELPRAATLRRIAEALDVSMDLLLDDVDSSQVRNSRARVLSGKSSDYDRHSGNGWDRDHHLEGPSRNRGYEPPMPVRANHHGRGNSRQDLERKFRELLDSPLGDGLARLIEESHRLLVMSPLGPTL